MEVMLLLVSCALELVMYFPPFWNLRRYMALVVALSLGPPLGLLIVQKPWWVLALLPVMTLRAVNLARIVKARMHPQHLQKNTARTSLYLLAILIIQIFVIWSEKIDVVIAMPTLACLQLLAAALLLTGTVYTVIKTKSRALTSFYSDKDLPTLTVAIPARNETAELAACLHSVLANDYPKLEVLVLDDCSQDKTAEIIRDFAQDGVRFIQGSEPSENWLAKNQAYQRLYEEATGQVILFCGVDVRLGAQTLRYVVSTLLQKERDMISILPLRNGVHLRGSLFQTMRYWWEVALPRRLFNRPPVLSTCWLIRRKTLKKLGGFGSVSRAILPERLFARELVSTNSYAFVRADEQLEVRSVKSTAHQIAIAQRTRYPAFRRRLELAALVISAELIFLFMPFVLFFSGFLYGFGWLQYMSGITCLLLVSIQYIVLATTNPASAPWSLLTTPLAFIADVGVILWSMFGYEFGEIEWKGRNVCLPVMHAVALPSQTDTTH